MRIDQDAEGELPNDGGHHYVHVPFCEPADQHEQQGKEQIKLDDDDQVVEVVVAGAQDMGEVVESNVSKGNRMVEGLKGESLDLYGRGEEVVDHRPREVRHAD